MDHERTAAAVEDLGEYPEMGDCVDDWSTICVWQPWDQSTQLAAYAVWVRQTHPGRLGRQCCESLSLAGTGDTGNDDERGSWCFSTFGVVYLGFLASIDC